MESKQFQMLLFEKITHHLDKRHSLVDHVTDILQVSKDSAYRRIRGETAVSFDEALNLAGHFGISLSEITGHSDNAAVFKKQPFIRSLKDYRLYMLSTLKQLEQIQENKNAVMYYSAKDIPVFYQYAYPKLAAFKMYVWLKSIYDIQQIDDLNYNLDMIPQELTDIAHQQWKVFSKINSVEIWNETTITSLLKQIEYYFEAGLLKDQDEGLALCNEFHQMIKLIYKQALSGEKVHASNHEVNSGASYKMYYHEILLMDNHIMADFGEERLAYFVPYGGVNYMSTTENSLTAAVKEYLLNQTKKSALISDVSEKERNRFFIRIKNRIDQLREKIHSTNPFS